MLLKNTFYIPLNSLQINLISVCVCHNNINSCVNLYFIQNQDIIEYFKNISISNLLMIKLTTNFMRCDRRRINDHY